MGAPRKDFTRAVDMYASGMSVEQVAEAYSISRQAMWNILARRGVAMRPSIRFGEANGFFTHGEGYAGFKKRAVVMVAKALKAGKLTAQPCEKCGFTGVAKDGRNLVQAHHHDYHKPLEVRWLCQRCHFKEHHP